MDLISLAAVVTFIAGVVACCAAIVCVISRVIR